MTSTQIASFTPQIVRISASSPLEAHEAREAQSSNYANGNSELSDVDADSDFDYDGSGSDDERSAAGHPRFDIQPQLSWATAAEDAANGIQYIKERFPGENIPYLPTPFRQEPIKVAPDDKVVVLDEVTEHAVRVRLVKTGEVGVIPMWTVEGPLEKLARENMLWNEIATSPAVEEPTTINSLRLPTRRRYSTDEEEEPDSDWPLTPTSPTSSFLPSSASSSSTVRRPLLIPSKPSTSLPASNTQSSTLRLKRKVEFSSSPRKMIFRYFPPHEPGSQWDSDSDSESEAASAQRSEGTGDSSDGARAEQEGDSNWWWDGWEEAHEDSEEDEEHTHHDDTFDIDRERERWVEGQRRRKFIVA